MRPCAQRSYPSEPECRPFSEPGEETKVVCERELSGSDKSTAASGAADTVPHLIMLLFRTQGAGNHALNNTGQKPG